MQQSTQQQVHCPTFPPGTVVGQVPSNQIILVQSVPYNDSPLDLRKLGKLRRVDILLILIGILSVILGAIGISILMTFFIYVFTGTLVS